MRESKLLSRLLPNPCWSYERSTRSCVPRCVNSSFCFSPFGFPAFIQYIGRLYVLHIASVCLTSSYRSNVNLFFTLRFATLIPTILVTGIVNTTCLRLGMCMGQHRLKRRMCVSSCKRCWIKMVSPVPPVQPIGLTELLKHPWWT